jgi:hypothetical protein
MMDNFFAFIAFSCYRCYPHPSMIEKYGLEAQGKEWEV